MHNKSTFSQLNGNELIQRFIWIGRLFMYACEKDLHSKTQSHKPSFSNGLSLFGFSNPLITFVRLPAESRQ